MCPPVSCLARCREWREGKEMYTSVSTSSSLHSTRHPYTSSLHTPSLYTITSPTSVSMTHTFKLKFVFLKHMII